MPSRTNAAFIRLTIRLRSRIGCRLAIGPRGVGILSSGGSRPSCSDHAGRRGPPRKARLSSSVSRRSGLGAPVLAQYGYAGCVDDVGLNAARLEPARQPEAVTACLRGGRRLQCVRYGTCSPASSRHRYNSFSNAASSTASFFNGWRSTRGAIPATSQLDRLSISITAIGVQSGLRVVRHRLRSFNFCMGRSIGSRQRRWMQYPRRRPIASSIMGFEDEAEQSVTRRCMITANRRASATIAFFIPQGLAVSVHVRHVPKAVARHKSGLCRKTD